MELTNNSASSSGRARPRPLIAGASLIKAPKSELTNDAARRPPKFRANNKKKKCGRIRRGRGDGPGRNRNRYQFLNWTRALKNNILAWQSKYLANPPWEMCPSRRLRRPRPAPSPRRRHRTTGLCFYVVFPLAALLGWALLISHSRLGRTDSMRSVCRPTFPISFSTRFKNFDVKVNNAIVYLVEDDAHIKFS